MFTEQEIKERIQVLLSQTPVDYGKVIELSNELAKFDSEKVRFAVDAGIISRIGEELVGKRETAVAELIKNAYDADATTVNVVFYFYKENASKREKIGRFSAISPCPFSESAFLVRGAKLV